jgi:hypothetical protein
MKVISSISLAPALIVGLLLTGCDAWYGYRHVPYEPGNQGAPGEPGERPSHDRSEHHAREVRGTVDRVDTGEHVIVLTSTGEGRGEVALAYDDDTRVDYQGRSYRPENLEHGDQIAAAVERTPEGLAAVAIHVLADVRGGQGVRGEEGARGGDVEPEEHEKPAAASTLRGVVRSNDSDGKTIEVERAGRGHERSEVVLVRYDGDTVVEFEGRRYGPENLERGDAVKIKLRDSDGPPTADHILVVGEGRPVH